jgi:hypothetical protein
MTKTPRLAMFWRTAVGSWLSLLQTESRNTTQSRRL